MVATTTTLVDDHVVVRDCRRGCHRSWFDFDGGDDDDDDRVLFRYGCRGCHRSWFDFDVGDDDDDDVVS